MQTLNLVINLAQVSEFVKHNQSKSLNQSLSINQIKAKVYLLTLSCIYKAKSFSWRYRSMQKPSYFKKQPPHVAVMVGFLMKDINIIVQTAKSCGAFFPVSMMEG